MIRLAVLAVVLGGCGARPIEVSPSTDAVDCLPIGAKTEDPTQCCGVGTVKTDPNNGWEYEIGAPAGKCCWMDVRNTKCF